MLTNFANLTDEEKTIWVKDTWHQTRENSFIMREMVGDDSNACIQRITELRKDEKGARAVITLVGDLEGDGVAGDRTLEGNEDDQSSFDQVIRIDMLRNAQKHEGRMADQKSVVNFRENSKSSLAYWGADRWDQMAFLTLSGVSYTKKTNGTTRVGSDLINLEFAQDVTAPSTNRHRRWDATSGLVAGDTSQVAAGDTPTWEMMVEVKAYLKNHFVRPVRGAAGMELYHVVMTPNAFAKLKLDPDFLAAMRYAMPRGSDNPLFSGKTTGLYVDGLMLHEFRHCYHASNWGGGAVQGCRVLFLGAQALAFADIGDPFWDEKYFDYNNQPGIAFGKIGGFLKPVFESQVTSTDEDFGVLCVDVAEVSA